MSSLAEGKRRLTIYPVTDQTKRQPNGCLCFVVEARGVEPLSENLLIWLSPGAGGYLNFPMAVGNRHSTVTGSFFLHDCLKSKRAMHVHR